MNPPDDPVGLPREPERLLPEEGARARRRRAEAALLLLCFFGLIAIIVYALAVPPQRDPHPEPLSCQHSLAPCSPQR